MEEDFEHETRGIQVVPRRKLLAIFGDADKQEGSEKVQEGKNPGGQRKEETAYVRTTLFGNQLGNMERRRQLRNTGHDN